MKTTEVNKELVGRRCECMCLGSMVTGVIEDITVTKYTAEVKVRYDEPQRWGNEVLHSGWAHGDKDDESGSLKYLRLLPEPVRPDYETLIVTFCDPIRTLERRIFDDPQAWGVSALKEWIDGYESTRFTQIGRNLRIQHGERARMARPTYRNRNLQNGVTMARERTDDWMQMAKDLARAERELQIEHWVYITFEYRECDRSRVVLHKIDMPRRMLDRWRWLVEWRRAKYVCQYPRKGVQVYYCYYDKRTGLQTGFGSLLSCVAAAKAQITKVERKIEEYVSYMSGNDLFFDPTTDEKLRCAKKKLAQKRAKYAELCALLQSEVAKHRANPGICKLFLGFRKLGEFTDIPQARKFAEESGETGTFNLIGNRFRDSWYQPKCIEEAGI